MHSLHGWLAKPLPLIYKYFIALYLKFNPLKRFQSEELDSNKIIPFFLKKNGILVS